MIIGHVRGQELKLDRTTIAADSIKYLEAEFHFAGRDWDGYVKTAMLSQPMAGKSEAEIAVTREHAIKALEGMGYTVVNTLFTDEWYSREAMSKRGVVHIPLAFFAKSVENMACCDAAYFCKGWESTRGCKLEHAVAEAYGVKIIYEED